MRKIIYPSTKFVILLMLFFVSCKKEVRYELLTGDLIGYVDLKDEFRNQITDNSGVKVTIEGSQPQRSTYTDTEGRYIIEDLMMGTYNIVFSKPGFGTHKIISYGFVGGAKSQYVRSQEFYRITDVQIKNLMIMPYKDSPYIELKVVANLYDEKGEFKSSFMCFLHDKEDVSNLNHKSSFVVNHETNIDILDFSFRVDLKDFHSGQKLYMIAYPTSYCNYHGYWDISTGEYIHTGIDKYKPSNVASITVPEIETSK